MKQAQALLDQIGLDGRRLRMIYLSSAMGKVFAEEATRITEEVAGLGPSPLHRYRDHPADPAASGAGVEEQTT